MKTICFPEDKSPAYRDLLSTLIGNAPEDGLTIDQVRISIKVLDVLSTSEGATLDLEDADYNLVLWRIEQARWRASFRDVIEFVDCIKSAK
ncbi:hypothetical protein ACQZ4R_13030 [Agrobacterium vitis]